MRKPLVAGNWKCNGTLAEAHALVRQLLGVEAESVEVVVCPPFTALASVALLLNGSSIGLGAQDLYWEAQGAYTGEISPAMLADAGCRYAIIGHSERRTLFGETDETVRKKLAAAFAQGLIPIMCIGETRAEREANRIVEVLARQLDGALKDVGEAELRRLVLAYEPVWAIGTGRTATPSLAQVANRFIRHQLAKRFGVSTAEALRILYGGSVNAGNAASLLHQADVDGALVGGASLKAESFAAIVKAAEEAKAAIRS